MRGSVARAICLPELEFGTTRLKFGIKAEYLARGLSNYLKASHDGILRADIGCEAFEVHALDVPPCPVRPEDDIGKQIFDRRLRRHLEQFQIVLDSGCHVAGQVTAHTDIDI